MGGKCSKCGYNKNEASLCIHHLKKADKEFDWNKLRLRTWKTIENEIKKCILVCANCHGEIHYPELNKSLQLNWTEYKPSKLGVAGSSPARDAILICPRGIKDVLSSPKRKYESSSLSEGTKFSS